MHEDSLSATPSSLSFSDESLPTDSDSSILHERATPGVMNHKRSLSFERDHDPTPELPDVPKSLPTSGGPSKTSPKNRKTLKSRSKVPIERHEAIITHHSKLKAHSWGRQAIDEEMNSTAHDSGTTNSDFKEESTEFKAGESSDDLSQITTDSGGSSSVSSTVSTSANSEM